MNIIDNILAATRVPVKSTHNIDPPETILPELENEPVAVNPVDKSDSVERPQTIPKQGTYSFDPPIKSLSLEQLEELLRKINLSFDLFEIQRIFVVDPSGNEEPKVEIRNTVTGELIRVIPTNELTDIYREFKMSVGSIINKFL